MILKWSSWIWSRCSWRACKARRHDGRVLHAVLQRNPALLAGGLPDRGGAGADGAVVFDDFFACAVAPCGCVSRRGLYSVFDSGPGDDIAVDLFAAKMKEKLAKSRDKGRGGWEDCPIEYLIASLKDHISKGDPVDVANFSMMISLRGESIKTPVWTVADQKAGLLPEVGSKYLGKNELNPEAELICDLIDGDGCVWGHDKNKKMFCFYASNIKPIESPAEKAQRLEDEFVVAMLDAANQEQLMSAGFKSGVIEAYRKLKDGE